VPEGPSPVLDAEAAGQLEDATSTTLTMSLNSHMARGSAWMVGMRWTVRLMGLVSTVILARLLTPADYGIVTIAMMIVGLVEVFGRTGQNWALIRHPNPTREHYDSAWTVALMIGVGLGALIWLVSPLTSIYFHEPRAELVVKVLAFRTMLIGAQNIAVVNFQRRLQFNRQFWFSTTPSMISFFVGIVGALILRNYWALVIAMISEQFTGFVLGYVMEPFRPRISFKKVREIWNFSSWSLVTSVGIYLNTLIDRFAIGGFAGAAAMGRYFAAMDIATAPTQEIVEPMVAAMFPVMSKVQNDIAKRRELYLTVLYWSALICCAAAVGIALIADDMVDLVLGSQWEDVKPLVPWLALSYGVLGLTSSVYICFNTIGQPRYSARLQWLRLALLAAAVFPVAYGLHDLEKVAMTRFIVTVVITPTLFLAIARAFDLKLRDFAIVLWRPFAAATVMTLAILGVNSVIAFTGNPRLLIDILLGGCAYIGTIMTLWTVTGQPAGPERALWRTITGIKPWLARAY